MGTICTVVIFLTCYVLFAVLPRHRHWVALAGALVMLLLGPFDLGIGLKPAFLFRLTEAGARCSPAVDWNVMGIFVGVLVVAELFMRSGMPAHIADIVIRHCPSARVTLLALCVLTGIISAFVENVATVLLIAPVALSITRRLGIRPVPFFIALAISSNLQSCATLIGDPPSMLLGSEARMTFNDFIWMHGRPSIFFAVQIGAVASFLVLMLVFRKHRQSMPREAVEPVKTWVPTILLTLLIIALAASSMLHIGFAYLAGTICMVFAVVALAYDVIWHRTDAWRLVKELDWVTTFFLLAIFIMVGALSEQGVLVRLAQWIQGITGESLLATYVLLIVIAMVVSAFVDNVPFLVAMLPVTVTLLKGLGYSIEAGDPQAYLLMFGLLIGAGLGGNISPIGASANIVAMGLMDKHGHRPTFWEFIRIGLPFTLMAIGSASIFVWFVWG
ncbi:MAG: TRAP transporter large permease subunit [Planctomycetes bacterium]|nr:TRAP transporter large permease subunit [Planctomycetota bacterium]